MAQAKKPEKALTLKSSKGFTATSMRGLLIFVLIIVLGAGSAGVYFGLQMIREYATEVSRVSADATASNTLVSDLQALEGTVAQSGVLIDKANRMFTTQQDYQGQALQDVRAYAEMAGLSISSTSFEAPAVETPAPTTPETTDPSMGTTTPTTPTPTQSTPQNVIVVTLDSPVSYAQLLKFIDAIEGNLPKMQIKDLNIQRPSAPAGDQVTVEAIVIQVLTR